MKFIAMMITDSFHASPSLYGSSFTTKHKQLISVVNEFKQKRFSPGGKMAIILELVRLSYI